MNTTLFLHASYCSLYQNVEARQIAHGVSQLDACGQHVAIHAWRHQGPGSQGAQIRAELAVGHELKRNWIQEGGGRGRERERERRGQGGGEKEEREEETQKWEKEC